MVNRTPEYHMGKMALAVVAIQKQTEETLEGMSTWIARSMTGAVHASTHDFNLTRSNKRSSAI